MLRDQENAEMFLFVQRFKEAEVLCVPAVLPPPPKSNGCSLQKSHLYKENIIKTTTTTTKNLCVLLRLLSISYTADLGIMRFFSVITWWVLDS